MYSEQAGDAATPTICIKPAVLQHPQAVSTQKHLSEGVMRQAHCYTAPSQSHQPTAVKCCTQHGLEVLIGMAVDTAALSDGISNCTALLSHDCWIEHIAIHMQY
jgi:hypothetical protein